MPSFWDHLDELRSVLIRCVVAWGICAVAAFCFRDALFAFLFAPSHPDFITYRLLRSLPCGEGWGEVSISFINTRLAAQFTTHMQVAALAGLVIAFPYLLWQLYGFLAPALYPHEKRAAGRIIGFGTLLFLCGVALNYLIIFPFAFRFLATYQVQPEVVNQIALDSYVSTLLILSLLMGILFEMPLVAWALGKAGLLEAAWLRQYRRHALVALMILAAVITPTGDAFTLMLVTVPLYLLYELSIIILPK
ncbi:MAG: twin-arginine translocase subunit TatC [Paludibacteraceae bacterium]|nr:twin-arginine translocase subunit TatC [Paludibacteraceae bacterium]MBR1878566.1 twin-arginine translocase subunit TatC [Paludibacteraceae bacterium]